MYAEDRIKAFLNESGLEGEDMNPEELRRMESYILGIPYVNLKDNNLEFEVLSYIPEPVSRTYSLIAYKRDEAQGTLEVAVLDMKDVRHLSFIAKKRGIKIIPRITDEESIRYALLYYQKCLKALFGDVIRSEALSAKGLLERGESMKYGDDASVIRIVDTLLKHACMQHASDIHIEPTQEHVLVRYRIGGVLQDAMTLPRETAPLIALRIKKLAHLHIDETNLPQDGRFTQDGFNVRVSILSTHCGEKIVMRIIPETTEGLSLQGLGFHGEALENVCEALMETSGLVLVVGPHQTGKTTTLYTMLDLLNTPEISISTIEDPIETQLTRVNQTSVKPQINFTFAHGLRALMRQDPDVIMVGDLRTPEVATLSVQAATNRMVCSGLYALHARDAIVQLIEKGIDSEFLASSLRMVIGQRLVRRLGKERQAYTLNKKEVDALSKECDMDKVLNVLKEEGVVDTKARWSNISFYRPLHESDEYTGYVGIQEVLPVTKTIKDLIEKEVPSERIEKQARKEGMLTLFEDGVFKAVQGLTTLEEVFRVLRG